MLKVKLNHFNVKVSYREEVAMIVNFENTQPQQLDWQRGVDRMITTKMTQTFSVDSRC
jgi:hypothetical protein